MSTTAFTTLNTQQLQELTGYLRAGDIEKFLQRNQVHYLMGKDGPITTLDALNAALGLKSGEPVKAQPIRLKRAVHDTAA